MTLSYTGIGFVDGDSCPITLDDREHDGAAASQLMRFLGGDPSIAAVDDATGERVHVDQVIREDAHDRHALRPRGRHDRRLLRRPDPVRRGRLRARAAAPTGSTRSSR